MARPTESNKKLIRNDIAMDFINDEAILAY
jgi:hypothetical protein